MTLEQPMTGTNQKAKYLSKCSKSRTKEHTFKEDSKILALKWPLYLHFTTFRSQRGFPKVIFMFA